MNSRLSHRSNESEVMDDLNCSGEVVNQSLRELEVINRWLGGNVVTIAGIKKLLGKENHEKTITIADIGCGGGDILKVIAEWTRTMKISFTLTGIDANPNIIRFAKANTKRYSEISFTTQNIFSEAFRKCTYDIVVATLFTHHFTNLELSDLLKSLYTQSKIGVVINDLHRHWLAYYSIRLLTRWFSKSTMVQYDGPLSVLRAFKRSDLVSILNQAGIEKYELNWKWAFRWQLIIPASPA